MLEVLVTIFVLGLIILGLAQGTRFGIAASVHQVRLEAEDQDMDAVDRVLRRLIQGAAASSEWESLAFAGRPHSLGLTTEMPLAGTGLTGNRADVELAVDSGHRLVMAWRRHRHVIAPAPPWQLAVLLPEVERIDLAYRLPPPARGWAFMWQGSALPQLVRIRIVFSNPARRAWPDLIAAPMQQAP